MLLGCVNIAPFRALTPQSASSHAIVHIDTLTAVLAMQGERQVFGSNAGEVLAQGHLDTQLGDAGV